MQKRYLWLVAGVLACVTSALSPAHAAPMPLDKHEDIGAPSPAGDTKISGTGAAAVYTLTGNGSDIWATPDQFQFAYTTLPGDGGITARILTQTGGNDNGWAKTGTMIRELTDPGSKTAWLDYANAGVTMDNNDAVGRSLEPAFRFEDNTQAQRAQGTSNVSFSGHWLDSHEYYRRLDTGPIWMRTQRQGQVYQHLASDDGQHWLVISQATISIDPKKAVLAGLCACPNGNATAVVVTFDNVGVDNALIPTGPVNVGGTPGTGAVLLTYSTVTNAVGYNIYRLGPTDKAFAKVNKDPVPNGWYIDDQGLTNGVSYSYRVVAQLQDGSETSATNQVTVEPQVPIGPGLVSYDIGTETAGITKLDGTTLTINGSGEDLWNSVDGFRYVAMPMAGNYSLTAKLLAKPAPGPGNGDGWIKAGVMIREDLTPGSRNATMLASSGNGVAFHWRRGGHLDNGQTQVDSPSEAEAGGTSDTDTTYPVFLRVVRNGDIVQGFQSSDGSTFTKVGDDITIPFFSPSTYAGLFVTAHNERLYGIAQFDLSTFKIQ